MEGKPGLFSLAGNIFKNTLSMINMPWPDRRFKEVWEFWKKYKYNEWRRFKYKSEQSEQTALNLLYKMANGDLETAIAIIQRSAGNRWQRLHFFNTGN